MFCVSDVLKGDSACESCCSTQKSVHNGRTYVHKVPTAILYVVSKNDDLRGPLIEHLLCYHYVSTSAQKAVPKHDTSRLTS